MPAETARLAPTAENGDDLGSYEPSEALLAELGELLVDGWQRLFEHAPVGGDGRAAEVIGGPGLGQLERFSTVRVRALLFGAADAGARAGASSCCASTDFDSQPLAMTCSGRASRASGVTVNGGDPQAKRASAGVAEPAGRVLGLYNNDTCPSLPGCGAVT